ncbi:uncharacterized protein LOC116351291 [Contarinia nasturtii]|uniref:uncharacterized protein LOC116351291 n=1 Tax=Contarinia nasturtii TaxID=265458 RepID=UPI0012D37476|nr:uncharacterized protein LOC116351291 [Contarinia nasturtii]XP_031639233.1 uncharacterized protein LOC116351291 [Contarinia nasturtii]XP_031639234.1 uncharacterized protein LOC116351291 [Contarinia nasturtii]XP_031639235.1 uncharacterized protein LOC116351291 [Contarinia nasturtii]XP_031639236.1 uncharacterized protein LOC116351291 [Contarinia nasturtii]XP_031639237.1 uncharacterized protein LOC116351291 [Contarinia nasturtii]
MAIGEENQQTCVSNRNALDPTAPPPDYYTLFPNPALVQNSREPTNSQPEATFIPITPHECRPVIINRNQSYALEHLRGNVVTSVPVQCANAIVNTPIVIRTPIQTSTNRLPSEINGYMRSCVIWTTSCIIILIVTFILIDNTEIMPHKRLYKMQNSEHY